jgi:hypothetical protein
MAEKDNARDDLQKEIGRLSREILRCQNSMEAGVPTYGAPDSCINWLGKLQTELADAEVKLAQLAD